MKSSLRYLLALSLVLIMVSGLLAAKQLYTCGMHPQIIREEPGDCPICGMKLQPVRANTVATSSGTAAASGERKIKYYKSTMTPGEVKSTPGKDSMGMDMVPVYEGEDSSAQSSIQIDAVTIQRMNLKTALVDHGPVRREFRTVGIIAYNEQGRRDITTKYDGWLEKLDVSATWTAVKTGDPLFEIYSPDLYNAQLNYLVALHSEGAAGGPLTRASLERLKLFDISADVVAQLAQSGEARRTYLYRAPADGVVIEKMAVQGQMMKSGERIYRLADLSTVWVNAQIYEKDLPYIHDGQAASVHMTYGQDRTIDGTIQLVLPEVEDLTRTATARIVLHNPDGYLKPGMFVDVRFAAQLADDAVLVPDMAVLRSGEHNTVFVALEGGMFEPRDVKLGARSEGGVYQVLSGLRAGERVVTSGQFMLDSESQLREAIEKMLKSAATEPVAEDQGKRASARPAVGSARKILHYQSSMMPKESSPAPAKDSMGMDMVPVYEESAQPSAPAAHPDAPASDPRQTGLTSPAAAGPSGQSSLPLDTDVIAMLPPGHPALDRATLAAFARAQPVVQSQGKSTEEGDRCGKCGMSQVAMAAGQSCDQHKE